LLIDENIFAGGLSRAAHLPEFFRMKVLHILDSLNRGGAETLELDVCRNAARNGLDLIFVATGGGTLETKFENSGVDFIRLRRRLPIDLNVVARLRRIIKKHRIEIVHTHQAVEGIHAYFAAFGTNTKVVLTYHGYVPDAKNRRALQFLIPRVAANVACSRFLLGWYASEFGFDISRNFTVLYNGADERRIAPSGKNLRAELKIADDAVLFGMIGNFYVAPRKDQKTLCQALPSVFNKMRDGHCVFVGKIEDGAENYFGDCVRFCKENGILDRVHFLGARPDVPDVLHSLDVFVLSSLHEGMPVAILEAMLAGVPCVLSDIAPNLEICENGRFAEIFPTGDSDALALRLLNLAENPDARRALAARGKQHAQTHFSIEAHIENLKKLYKNLV
jgi:L-malate glycosyltransferase